MSTPVLITLIVCITIVAIFICSCVSEHIKYKEKNWEEIFKDFKEEK